MDIDVLLVVLKRVIFFISPDDLLVEVWVLHLDVYYSQSTQTFQEVVFRLDCLFHFAVQPRVSQFLCNFHE